MLLVANYPCLRSGWDDAGVKISTVADVAGTVGAPLLSRHSIGAVAERLDRRKNHTHRAFASGTIRASLASIGCCGLEQRDLLVGGGRFTGAPPTKRHLMNYVK